MRQRDGARRGRSQTQRAHHEGARRGEIHRGDGGAGRDVDGALRQAHRGAGRREIDTRLRDPGHDRGIGRLLGPGLERLRQVLRPVGELVEDEVSSAVVRALVGDGERPGEGDRHPVEVGPLRDRRGDRERRRQRGCGDGRSSPTPGAPDRRCWSPRGCDPRRRRRSARGSRASGWCERSRAPRGPRRRARRCRPRRPRGGSGWRRRPRCRRCDRRCCAGRRARRCGGRGGDPTSGTRRGRRGSRAPRLDGRQRPPETDRARSPRPSTRRR